MCNIHPELLRGCDGYDFWYLGNCDPDDLGRWATEAWHDAEHATIPDEMQQYIWFARACEAELARKSQPIVCM